VCVCAAQFGNAFVVVVFFAPKWKVPACSLFPAPAFVVIGSGSDRCDWWSISTNWSKQKQREVWRMKVICFCCCWYCYFAGKQQNCKLFTLWRISLTISH